MTAVTSPTTSSATPRSATIPAAAAWLGGLGLLPFLVPALLLWLGPAAGRELAWLALHAYAAVILSFIGAVHWGATLHEADSGRLWRAMGWSVLPALLAWVTLLMPHPQGVALLLLGFAAQYLADRRAAATGRLPVWYGRLRRVLTAGVVASLALARGV